MDFEDQEPHDHEQQQGQGGDLQQPMGPSYDSLNYNNSNSAFTRPSKFPTSPVALDVEPQSQRKPRYRECLKNHAVSIGAQAVDGCGEFLPAGAEGTLDALKCAACSCHRNFHRKETYPVVHGGVIIDPFQMHHHQTPPPPPLLTHYPHTHHQQQFSPPYYRSMASASPTGFLQVGAPPRPPQLALPSNSGGGGGGGGSGGAGVEEGMNSGGEGGTGWNSKKRFRTKFSTEQKERMVAFAQRVGWKIQKQDEDMVQQFCNDIGLKRHVLKVWMHNNKHTIGMGKPEQEEVKKE